MKIKKISAILLSIVLAFSIIAVPASAAMPFEETSYFEDFSDENLSKWESTNKSALTTIKGFVTDGALTVPDTNDAQLWLKLKDNAFDFANYNDYTVSCDITFGEKGISTSGIRTSGIAARMTSANIGGYEFQLVCDADATTGYVRLFDRSKALGTNGIISTNKGTEAQFEIGTVQTVSMTVKGNKIECFLNGVSVISYTDETNTYATGYAGIRLPTKNCINICDNFEVKYTKLLDNLFYDDFSSYTQDTNTNKRIAMTNNGWYVYNNNISGVVNNGEISIPANSALNHFGMQCSGAKKALAWNDYSVEADVIIGEGSVTNSVYAGVGGRYNGVVGVNPNGYEIQIFIKSDLTTGMRIYSRGGKADIAVKDIAIVQGQKYNVKAVFQGDTINAYLDDKLVLTATDSQYPIGYAGIRYIGNKNGTGVATTIDNFVVYDYDVASEPTPNMLENFDKYTPSFLEDGVTYDKQYIQGSGWGSITKENLTNYVPYFDAGKLTIPTSADADVNLFYDTTKAKAWANYSVSMDVKSEATTGGTYLFFGGRCSDYKTGYFVKIYMGASGHIREIRLQDKYKGTDIGTAYGPATADRPLCTDYYNIKLEMKGTSIKVYLNGKAIIEATDDTYTVGSIALDAGIKSLANVSPVVIDNIKVIDFDNLIQYKRTVVGDVNADDELDATDLSALLDGILDGTATADVNMDGVSDILDIIRLKKIFASM